MQRLIYVIKQHKFYIKSLIKRIKLTLIHIILKIKMIKQIFQTDSKYWNQSERDQIQQFFQFNSFFSKFYDHNNWDDIMSMTFYTNIDKSKPIYLQNNKRPAIIILLSGKINISRKRFINLSQIKTHKRTSKFNKLNNILNIQDFYESTSFLEKQNQSFSLDYDCRISALDQNNAHILFIPQVLYKDHIGKIQNLKYQRILNQLLKFFPNINKRVFTNLVTQHCWFKQFRMNQFVYKMGSQPVQVYLLIQGNVRLEKPKLFANKTHQMIILNPDSIFGEKDLMLQHRQKSVVACSAKVKTIAIDKNAFIQFAKQYLPKIEFKKQQDKFPLLSSRKSTFYQIQDDQIFSHYNLKRSLKEQAILESQVMKNCHVLSNLSPKGSKSGRFQIVKDYAKDQFQEKLKLYKKFRPNSKNFDIEHPMIPFLQKRPLSLRRAQIKKSQKH